MLFIQCVASAICEKGIKGLLEMVPGGPYIYSVAEAALKKYQERKKAAQQQEEIQQLAQKVFEQARVEGIQAGLEAVAEAKITPTPEEQECLNQFLIAIPAHVRQSLKRPEDPTGRSVPNAFALKAVDDVVKLLPARPPQFRPAMALPGMAGWTLEKLLGIGGYGEVWLARHNRVANLCGAVKFCIGETARELQHESSIIDRLMTADRHPNIVPLTNANLDADVPWLMYEYVSGGTLTDWIHQLQALTPEVRIKQVMTALKQLTEAVASFHRLDPPLIHRDLKPANILLDRKNNKLRITDFGIGAVAAKTILLEESRGQSTRGGRLHTHMRGSHTPLYASPQQRTGADPDPRDDVHALGVIAYQMLTGHLAQGAGPDFADDLNEAGAPASLIELLGKCVAQKAERRPKNVLELLEKLQTPGPSATAVPVPVVVSQAELVRQRQVEEERRVAERQKADELAVQERQRRAEEEARRQAEEDDELLQKEAEELYRKQAEEIRRDAQRRPQPLIEPLDDDMELLEEETNVDDMDIEEVALTDDDSNEALELAADDGPEFELSLDDSDFEISLDDDQDNRKRR